MRAVEEWLKSLGFGEYAERFVENDIDWTILAELTDQDLEKIGVDSLGHRRRLLRAIAALNKAPEGGVAPAPPPVAHPAQLRAKPADSSAERRPITILFCDLVGSTSLASKLDAEDWRDLVGAYLDAASEAVTSYGGHVLKRLGDGLMALFGYPTAQENDAERAARAALAIQRALTGINARNAAKGAPELAARIGLESGPVVVDAAGEVFGEAPNVAARVQAAAEPGSVLVTANVQRQIAGLFVAEEQGQRPLKGVPQPVMLYRIVRASGGGRRSRARAPTPLVGRADELDLLMRRWERARSGSGQFVQIVGDPGIGKSRLVEEFHARLAETPHTWVEWSSSQLLQNTPLHPVAEWGRQRFGDAETPAGQRLADLENTLTLVGLDPAEHAPLLAPLVEIPLPPDRAANLAPEELRRKQLQALTAWVLAGARSQPVALAFEDLHWADPTSLALMATFAERGHQAPLFILATTRPDFRPPWSLRSHHSVVSLSPLDRADVARMVGELQRHALSKEVVEGVSERTGGVPLFVEEVTRLLLERGEAGGLQAIPPTLQQSLAARLDRLGEAREVAQIGAVLGRDLSYALLRTVGGINDPALQTALDRLVDADLLFVEGAPPQATYRFKHALVRDAAYGMLLRETRRELHARIAETLERYPDDVAARPEIIAHHLAEASLVDRAITYLRKAARAAINRWANAEAAEHLTRSLKLATQLPEAAAREKVELDLLLELGPILMTVRGVASQEVQEVYRRAHNLCRDETEPAQLFAAKWGLWNTEHHHSRFEAAHHLATQLLDVAQASGDPSLLLQAHHSAWTSLFVAGENQKALSHAQKGIEIYDLDAHRDHATRYGGHDPGVCANMMGGMAAWFSGLPAYAAEMSAAAIELGRMLGEPFSWAMALSFGATVAALRREPAVVIARGAALQELLARHQLALGHIGSTAKVLTGWAIATEGKHEEGRLTAEAGVAELRGSGYARRSFQLGMMAAVYRLVGDASAALKTLDEALQIGQTQGETRWHSQILYERGLALVSADDDERAEHAFTESLKVSRQQKILLPELRAAIGLAKLWRDRTRRREAHELLAPIYGSFTQGFDTLDLKEAKALLDELAP